MLAWLSGPFDVVRYIESGLRKAKLSVVETCSDRRSYACNKMGRGRINIDHRETYTVASGGR